MRPLSVPFAFSRRFPFPADRAFAWAVDYDPGDIVRMGRSGGRSIRRLADDAFVLTDTMETPSGAIRKRKLVRVYPALRAWVNTTLAGPGRLSQFHYQIVAEGPRRSRLDFHGLQLLWDRPALTVPPRERERMARQLAREDGAIWKHLARAMARDLGVTRPGASSRRAPAGARRAARPRRRS
jgi:hypothetical protein